MVIDQPVSRLLSFVRFATVSGLGWLLDLSILLSLVRYLEVPASVANLVSSCTAALSVFLVSRYLVFQRAKTGLGLRMVLYLAYTLVVIVLAGVVIQVLLGPLSNVTRLLGLSFSATGLAAIAKIIVTPPQLLLNFVVARAMNERVIGSRDRS